MLWNHCPCEPGTVLSMSLALLVVPNSPTHTGATSFKLRYAQNPVQTCTRL